MTNDNLRKDFETLGEAARRVLAGVEARKRPVVETTTRIRILCRYRPSTAQRKASTLTVVAMEYSTKRQGAAVIPSVGGVGGRELWGGQLANPVPSETANRPTLDDASQADRTEPGKFLNPGVLQRMRE